MTVKLRGTLPKKNGLADSADEFMANPGETRVVILVVETTGYHHDFDADEDVPELGILRAELVPFGVQTDELVKRATELAEARTGETPLPGVVIEGDFPGGDPSVPPDVQLPDEDDGGDVA